MKRPEELSHMLTEMYNDTKDGKIRWNLSVQTTENNEVSEKPVEVEDGVSWTIDECYVSYYCKYKGQDFLMITYEMIKTAGDKVHTTNMIFLPPLGIRVFQLPMLLPYAVQASGVLANQIHNLWELLLAMKKADPESVFMEVSAGKLVIEDEKRLAQNLAELLRRQGYTVDVSSDGVSGYDNASTDLYDLILLDAMLPGMDGFTLLRKLRAGGHAVPVLMLTARSDLSDRVQGLDCGADYYLTKPFEPEELLACVRSLLRRGGGDARTDDAITFGDLRLEPGTFQLSCGERSLRLSRREYDLLELLLRSQGRVVPKEQLLLKVWGYDSDAEDNNVEVYISFLRRKLTHLHSAVTIRTRRMVGYFLEVEA